MCSEILIAKTDKRGIFYLNLNRPNIMNAFDDKLIFELNEVFLSLKKIKILEH